MIEQIRSEFEAEWQKLKPGVDMQRHGDFYYNDAAQTGWQWWLKARSAGNEAKYAPLVVEQHEAGDPVSARAAAFLVELEALCQKHQIQPWVAPSGSLQLHDRQEGDAPMTDDLIEDCLGKDSEK